MYTPPNVIGLIIQHSLESRPIVVAITITTHKIVVVVFGDIVGADILTTQYLLLHLLLLLLVITTCATNLVLVLVLS